MSLRDLDPEQLAMSGYQTTLIKHAKRAGIDPGKKGRVAIITDTDVIQVRSIPLIETPNGFLTDPWEMANLIDDVHNTHGELIWYVERVGTWQARPTKEGEEKKSNAFSIDQLLRSSGALEAALAVRGCLCRFVGAANWKQKAKLTGKDKKASVLAARTLFPESAHLIKSDDNTADAILIALYGPTIKGSSNAETQARRHNRSRNHQPKRASRKARTG